MNKQVVCLLVTLTGVGMLAGGCTTTGPTAPSRDVSGPHRFLNGAEAQQAKSVAMGSAVSKGWKIIDAADNKLLVGREVDAAAASSVTGEPVSTASIEVTTEFSARAGGVDVYLHAALIANKGTESEKRIDFTDTYKNELDRSLDSLQRSWEEAHWRVASATPPLPASQPTFTVESTQSVTPAVQAWQSAVTETRPVPGERGALARTEAPASASAPVVTASADDSPGPEDDGYAAQTPPTAPVRTAAASPEDDMLVLNRTAEPGVWAYYAEHYAKIRGCDVADSGAVLEEKQPDYEIHHVYCDNGQEFLVKCNAGTCRGMQ